MFKNMINYYRNWLFLNPQPLTQAQMQEDKLASEIHKRAFLFTAAKIFQWSYFIVVFLLETQANDKCNDQNKSERPAYKEPGLYLAAIDMLAFLIEQLVYHYEKIIDRAELNEAFRKHTLADARFPNIAQVQPSTGFFKSYGINSSWLTTGINIVNTLANFTANACTIAIKSHAIDKAYSPFTFAASFITSSLQWSHQQAIEYNLKHEKKLYDDAIEHILDTATNSNTYPILSNLVQLIRRTITRNLNQQGPTVYRR